MMAHRGAKSPVKNTGMPARTNLASKPGFLIRTLGLLDPATVEQPVNRQQRRAQRMRRDG